jgi:hypothetical protein
MTSPLPQPLEDDAAGQQRPAKANASHHKPTSQQQPMTANTSQQQPTRPTEATAGP